LFAGLVFGFWPRIALFSSVPRDSNKQNGQAMIVTIDGTDYPLRKPGMFIYRSDSLCMELGEINPYHTVEPLGLVLPLEDGTDLEYIFPQTPNCVTVKYGDEGWQRKMDKDGQVIWTHFCKESPNVPA
jgi:hypothetical protein